MKRQEITQKSTILDKDMHVLVYGETGYPIIVFPTQDAMADNFENFGMIDTLTDYLDEGQIQLFCVDSVDAESWSAVDGDKDWRAARQEQYYNYVVDELVPLVTKTSKRNVRPILTGCSMGATQAAIMFLRRPDLFQGVIGLSGVYDAQNFFGDWMSPVLYYNSPVHFLPNCPADHPYIKLYNNREIVLCVGQGAWEEAGVRSQRVLADAFEALGVDAWCDFWGYDVNHDWPWWKQQIRYFLPYVLEEAEQVSAEEAQEGKTKKAATKKPTATRKATTTSSKTATGAAKKAVVSTARGAKATAKTAAATTKAAAPKKTTAKTTKAAASKTTQDAAPKTAKKTTKAAASKTAAKSGVKKSGK